MEKRIISMALLSLLAGQALASSNVYIAPKVGWSNGEISDIDIDYRYSELIFTGTSVEPDSSNTNVVAWGGAVGYEYNTWKVPLRFETEYLYRNRYQWDSHPCAGNQCDPESDISTTIDSQTILANFYIDIPVVNMLSVFLGTGLGAALNFTDSHATFVDRGGSGFAPNDIIRQTASGKMHDYSFSWMATAGVTFNPLDWLFIDLSYRYSDLGDITWRLDNSAELGKKDSSATSLSTVSSDTFSAQEAYLGIRLMIPDFYQKPQKSATPRQYKDK